MAGAVAAAAALALLLLPRAEAPLSPRDRAVGPLGAELAPAPRARVGYRVEDPATGRALLRPNDRNVQLADGEGLALGLYRLDPAWRWARVLVALPGGLTPDGPAFELPTREAPRYVEWPAGLPGGARAVVLVYGPDEAAVAAPPAALPLDAHARFTDGDRVIVVVSVEHVR